MLRIRTGAGLEIADRTGARHEASGPDRRFDDEIAAFLDAIDGAPAAIPTGEDGRAVLAIALAVMQSSTTGQPVHLDHPPVPAGDGGAGRPGP
jgi:predicted dehydrogenase